MDRAELQAIIAEVLVENAHLWPTRKSLDQCRALAGKVADRLEGEVDFSRLPPRPLHSG